MSLRLIARRATQLSLLPHPIRPFITTLRRMGKKKSLAEEFFVLPTHHSFASPIAATNNIGLAGIAPANRDGGLPSVAVPPAPELTPVPSSMAAPIVIHDERTPIKIVDTHTHLISTFGAYRSKYPDGKYTTVFEFVRGMFSDRNGVNHVEAIVDVYCEAPVNRAWKELADSALTEEQRKNDWGGVQYYFVMGVHPHEAKLYDDAVERDILEAMAHPRCVGWGEIGLDYHYDNSPRDIQQQVLARQIQQAVRLGKPITIHTREAEADTEKILKAELPRDWKIHVHCFTDSPAFAKRLLDWFPNLHIGVTGVITYASNLDTTATVRMMAAELEAQGPRTAGTPGGRPPTLRIVLETDAPYMVPANIYPSIEPVEVDGKQVAFKGKLPFSHTGMIPWTADFLEGVLAPGFSSAPEPAVEGGESKEAHKPTKLPSEPWTAERILQVGRENARWIYGV